MPPALDDDPAAAAVSVEVVNAGAYAEDDDAAGAVAVPLDDSPEDDDADEDDEAAGDADDPERSAGAGELESVCHNCFTANAHEAEAEAFECAVCGVVNYVDTDRVARLERDEELQLSALPSRAPTGLEPSASSSAYDSSVPPSAAASRAGTLKSHATLSTSETRMEPLRRSASTIRVAKGRAVSVTKSRVPLSVVLLSLFTALFMVGIGVMAVAYVSPLMATSVKWAVWAEHSENEQSTTTSTATSSVTPDRETAHLWFHDSADATADCDALLDGLEDAVKEDPELRELRDVRVEVLLTFGSAVIFFLLAVWEKLSTGLSLYRSPQRWVRRGWGLHKLDLGFSRGQKHSRQIRTLNSIKNVDLARFLWIGKFFSLDPVFAIGSQCNTRTLPAAGTWLYILVMLVVCFILCIVVLRVLVKTCGCGLFVNRVCCFPVRLVLYALLVVFLAAMLLGFGVTTFFSVPQFSTETPSLITVLQVSNWMLLLIELVTIYLVRYSPLEAVTERNLSAIVAERLAASAERGFDAKV